MGLWNIGKGIVKAARKGIDPVYKSKSSVDDVVKEMSTLRKKIGAAGGRKLDANQLDVGKYQELATKAKGLKKDWRSALNDRAESNIGKLSKEIGETYDAVLGAHAKGDFNRTLMAVGAGGVIGAGMGLATGENAIWEGVKGAAMGAMYERVFPVYAAIDIAHSITSAALSSGRVLDQMDRSVQVKRVTQSAKYNPTGPPNPGVGNQRRRSASYQQSSRQNTNSFIGSEASFMHGNS